MARSPAAFAAAPECSPCTSVTGPDAVTAAPGTVWTCILIMLSAEMCLVVIWAAQASVGSL